MNAPDNLFLPDIQSAPDGRRLAIQRVGIKGLRYPVRVAGPAEPQPAVGSIDMTVALPATKKGTHMSRFIEVLQAHTEPLGAGSVRRLLAKMLTRLDADEGRLEICFTYFVRKAAPVSGVESLLDYRVRVSAERTAGRTSVWQQVTAPVTSLCPCSKEISDYGAHNQRSDVTIDLELEADLAIEEQVKIAERAASSELWPLLKRPDEKYVTERAYENPKFVEDIVRDIAVELDRLPTLRRYRVECENFEAIHNHSAYARIERSALDGAV